MAYLDLLKLSLCDLAGAGTRTVSWTGDRRVFSRELTGADQLEWRIAGRDWPLNALTMVGLRRLDDLQACVESVVHDGVEGDVIEAGTWRGGASILIRAALDEFGARDRTVWVADSFQGFPRPEEDGVAENEGASRASRRCPGATSGRRRGSRRCRRGRVDAVVHLRGVARRRGRAGARLIGTHEYRPSPHRTGCCPAPGRLLAAVATAAESVPEVAGRTVPPPTPSGRVDEGARGHGGDRPATDGELAAKLGIPFALVLSGVTRPGAGS